MVKAAKTPSQPLRTTRVSVKPAAAAPVITTVLRAKRNAPAAKAGPKNKQSPARSKADEECKSKGEQRWERKRPAAQEKVPMIDLEGQDENEDATNTPKRQRTASSPARSRTPQQQTETPRKPPSPCTPAKTPRAARSPARSPAIQPEAKPSTPAKTPTPRAKRSLASSPAEQPADKKPITPAKSPRAARSPPPSAVLAASFPWGAPGRVSVGDMQRTLGACIGSPHEETMRGLPSQHQLVLATAVVASRAGGVPPKQLTLQRLHTEYARALKKHHLQPLAFSEFVDLCEALGDHALLRVAAGKDPRARRVTVAVQEGDAVRALSSVAVVGAILAPPKPKE